MHAHPVNDQRRPGQLLLLETPVIAQPSGRARLALDPAQAPELLLSSFLAEPIA